TTIPGASPDNTIETYAHIIAGIAHEVIVNETGLPIITDPLAINRQSITAEPGSGSTMSQRGATLTLLGATHPQPADTSYFNSLLKTRFGTTATAGSVVGWRNNAVAEIFRSRGFRTRAILGTTNLVAGQRAFWGLSNSTAVPLNIDPIADTTIIKIGFGYNANTGNIKLIHNAATAAPTTFDLGPDFPVNSTDAHLYFMSALPNGNINWDVRKMSALDGSFTAQQTGVISTNLPPANTGLFRYGMVSNNTTAAIASLDVLQLNSHRM
ncbi:MAG: hypothetical protein ACRCVX_10555, partial [Shewanella sp.]